MIYIKKIRRGCINFFLQKYIVSAAHCFCAPGYGNCVENNGFVVGKVSSGHFRFGGGTVRSRLVWTQKWSWTLSEHSASIRRSLPASISWHRVIWKTTTGKGWRWMYQCYFGLFYDVFIQAEINLKSVNVYKAKSVKIHPLYVKNKRDQNDIALIKIRKSFDFSDREKVSPICLPSK